MLLVYLSRGFPGRGSPGKRVPTLGAGVGHQA